MENRAKMSRCIKQDCSTYSTVIKLVKRHHEPPVLLYFSGFPGWLAWFSLQIFCLNNKIHFSLANANNSASFKRKMVWKWRFLLIHKQQTNLWMKLPTIPPGLAGKIVKYRPLSEPIRLQDLEDSARSQAWKKVKTYQCPTGNPSSSEPIEYTASKRGLTITMPERHTY